MKQKLAIVLIIANCTTVFAQEITLDHFPAKTSIVTDEDYNRGKYFLTNTYQAIREDNGRLTYIDYWNVALGSLLMGEDHEVVFKLLERSKTEEPGDFCRVVQRQIDQNGRLEHVKYYQIFGERFANLISDCKSLTTKEIENTFNSKQGLDLKGLNENLIDTLIIMIKKDQRFRYKDSEYKMHLAEQTQLDYENQLWLKKIFDKYSYPGKSIVGERFMDNACLIFEHGGDLAFQEKYFSIVAQAQLNGQASKSVVRMLIDRIHWKKTGKQIFGSHIGVPFDDDKVIQEVKAKYKL